MLSTANKVELKDYFNILSNSDWLTLEIKKSNTDIIIFNPGLQHIAICKSNISKIDGNLGKLYYRGVQIEDIIENNDYLDVAFNLIIDEPNNTLLRDEFKKGVLDYFNLSSELEAILNVLPTNLHPMDFLSIGVTSLSAIEKKYFVKGDMVERSKFLIAQVAVISSYYLLRQQGRLWNHNKIHGEFASQIISKMFEENNSSILQNADILNKMLILHAEHEQNCSTVTVRSVASAGGDIYNAIAAGIASFKGKLHGGASQFVAEMYDEILQHNSDVKSYINKKINKKERLMGFGHRVYNCWDPRAKIMFNMLKSADFSSNQFSNYVEIALQLIDITSTDDYFIKRNIYPNPDLLNGIFFKILGVPSNMNTVMLSMSRVAGWLAHYLEHVNDKQPIMRPRQIPK